MFQTTYIGTRTPTVGGDALEAILLTARRRNLANGVTGLLVFDGRRFLQALEGERRAVEETFARIAADPRHSAIVVLSAREVEKREFGMWAMASRLPSCPAAKVGSLADEVDALTECVPDADARALFRSFARLQSAA